MKERKKKKPPNHRNISNYINNMLETSTYLTGGISLPKVFPTLQRQRTLSYKSTKIICSNREKKSKWGHINLAKVENIQTYWHKNVIHYQFHVTYGGREYYLEEMQVSRPWRPVMVLVGPHSTLASPCFRSHMVFLWKSGWFVWFGWVSESICIESIKFATINLIWVMSVMCVTFQIT